MNKKLKKKWKARCVKLNCEHLIDFSQSIDDSPSMKRWTLCSLACDELEYNWEDYFKHTEEMFKDVNNYIPKQCPNILEHIVMSQQDSKKHLAKSICKKCVGYDEMDKHTKNSWEGEWSYIGITFCKQIKEWLFVTDNPPEECPYKKEHDERKNEKDKVIFVLED